MLFNLKARKFSRGALLHFTAYCISLICVSVLIAIGCAHAPIRPVAPVSVRPALAITRAEMRNPEFWLGRIGQADKVILSINQVKQFNAENRKKKLIVDMASFAPEYDGRALARSLTGEWAECRGRNLYLGGSPAPQAFWKEIKELMALDRVPENIPVRFGFILRRAEQRVLPSDELLAAKPGDVNFDQLQNSSFDTGQPLAVLHESRDGKWVYGAGQSSSGWFHKDLVAFCTGEQFRNYLGMPYVTVISAKAGIFRDPEMAGPYETVRMGTRLALGHLSAAANAVEVVVPSRDSPGNFVPLKAYLGKGNVVFGHLSYTYRTVLTQAFKLLDAPYGWGGSNGEQDCSSFMQEVFGTVGIDLPRNSADQVKAGEGVKDISSAAPGITLLGMKGHIMLYLGEYDNHPYAIHAVWSYRKPTVKGEQVIKIGKVAVTLADLGRGSSKGSWLQRVNAIRIVR